MSINSLVPPRVARQNPLKALDAYGQSVWLDYICRSLITSGELQRLVDEDGLRGVTSNPAIFAQAIASSDNYTIAIAELARHGHTDPKTIFEELAILDIQAAGRAARGGGADDARARRRGDIDAAGDRAPAGRRRPGVCRGVRHDARRD